MGYIERERDIGVYRLSSSLECLWLRTNDTRDGKRVKEGVGVLKGDCSTIDQRFPVVHKAVVVAKASERFGVDETGRAKPAAV